MGLISHIAIRTVRHGVRKAAGTTAEAEPLPTEEERMLASLDPELADALKARMAAASLGMPADPARSGITWDTTQSVAPPG